MIYIETPISEKPEKAGNYQLIENSGSIGGIINMYDPEKFGDVNGGWFLYITKNYKFWLKPVEGVVMNLKELHDMWNMAGLWAIGKTGEYPDFNEYIKRFKL